MVNNVRGQLSVQEIMAIIPHRPPFLFVDRIIELVPGVRIRGIKNGSRGEGVSATQSPYIVVEAIAQVAVILAAVSMAEVRRESDLFFFAGIRHATISDHPGACEQLELTSEVERIRKGLGWFYGTASAGGREIVSVSMQAAMKST